MIVRRVRPRLPGPRNVVVLLPNGFTLLNLFLGIFAIVQASRGKFGAATLFIVLGGVADMLDGRIARATGTGSKFGEELDSLVDAITFGLAPALIMYFAVLDQQGWDWLWVFVYSACAVMRLARFNVEQAGKAKTHFHGLPSPAAGMTLATYIWFGQTRLYNSVVIFFTDNTVLADLPWHAMMRFVMLGLALLMISNVPYPTVPSIGFRTFRQVMGTLVVVGSILGVIFLPREFFFPVLLGYVLFGIVQYAVIGILDRPATPTIFLEEEPPDPESIPMEAVAAIGPPERPPRPERPSGSERNRERRPDREPRPEREPREPREPKPDREGRPAPGAPDADEAEEARRRKRRRRGRKDRERGERPDRPDRGGTPETTDAGDRPAPPPPPSPPIQEPNE